MLLREAAKERGLCTVAHSLLQLEDRLELRVGAKGEEQQRRDKIVNSGVDTTMYRSIYLL